jgi:hypothetical protein
MILYLPSKRVVSAPLSVGFEVIPRDLGRCNAVKEA